MPNGKREEEIKSTLRESFQNAKMGFFTRLKKSLLHPSEFFSAVKPEAGIGKPLKFLVVLYVIFAVVFTALLGVLGISFLSFLLLFLPFLGTAAVVVGVFLLVALLIMSFVSSAVLHIFAKIFRSAGSYSATYKAFAYSQGPILLMSVFLFLPFFAGIALVVVAAVMQLYILITGLSHLHDISRKRALAAALLPGIIALVILFLLNRASFAEV